MPTLEDTIAGMVRGMCLTILVISFWGQWQIQEELLENCSVILVISPADLSFQGIMAWQIRASSARMLLAHCCNPVWPGVDFNFPVSQIILPVVAMLIIYHSFTALSIFSFTYLLLRRETEIYVCGTCSQGNRFSLGGSPSFNTQHKGLHAKFPFAKASPQHHAGKKGLYK